MATRSPLQCSAGPENGLHRAAKTRFTTCEHLDALVASGFDINGGDPNGFTPLMIAVVHGHSRVVTLLLDRGADVSRKGGTGITALHISAASGNLAMTDMLIAAGANLEKTYQSATPLQLAMGGGHLEVVRAMVKAGANVDRRHHSGATALSVAASDGLLDIVELLLGANANPLLTTPNSLPGGPPLVALDAAARGGHAAVVRRMIGELGIEGCGGATISVSALYQAATNQRIDVMAILVDAGVVDNGYALVGAAACGAEAIR